MTTLWPGLGGPIIDYISNPPANLPKTRKIVVLGSTGSIGRSVLDIARKLPTSLPPGCPGSSKSALARGHTRKWPPCRKPIWLFPRKAEAWAFAPPLQACWRERQCVSPTRNLLFWPALLSGKFARQATPQSCRLIPNIMRFFNVLQDAVKISKKLSSRRPAVLFTKKRWKIWPKSRQKTPSPTQHGKWGKRSALILPQ